MDFLFALPDAAFGPWHNFNASTFGSTTLLIALGGLLLLLLLYHKQLVEQAATIKRLQASNGSLNAKLEAVQPKVEWLALLEEQFMLLQRGFEMKDTQLRHLEKGVRLGDESIQISGERCHALQKENTGLLRLLEDEGWRAVRSTTPDQRPVRPFSRPTTSGGGLSEEAAQKRG